MNQEHIKKTIEEIFSKTNCALTSCEFNEEHGMLWCTVQTPDSRFMIGREGETLRSLNHLVSKIVEKDMPEGSPLSRLLIDINGYQKKQFDELKGRAHMMAERARYFKSRIELDPMPAFERRIIHTFLESAPDLKTESEGTGPNRHIVITYTENKL